MILFIAIIMVLALLLLILGERESGHSISSTQNKKLGLILLIGILTVAAIFSPEVKEKISALKQKLKL